MMEPDWWFLLRRTGLAESPNSVFDSKVSLVVKDLRMFNLRRALGGISRCKTRKEWL